MSLQEKDVKERGERGEQQDQEWGGWEGNGKWVLVYAYKSDI